MPNVLALGKSFGKMFKHEVNHYAKCFFQIWYEFRLSHFLRDTLYFAARIYLFATPRDCTAFWPCASGSVRRKGALLVRRNVKAANKVFFSLQ